MMLDLDNDIFDIPQNGIEVDFTKVISIEKKSIAKLEIINSKDKKSRIMIELNK